MNNIYAISILMVLTGNCAYQLCQKFINTAVNPLVSLIMSYFVGMMLGIGLLIFSKPEKSILSSIQELNWASYALGITLVIIDAGFILAYRAGWKLSFVSVLYNVIPIILMVTIGMLFFKDKLTFINLLGVVVTIIGVLMVNWGNLNPNN